MNADHEATRVPRRRWLRFSLAGLLFVVLCWAGILAGFRFGSQRIALSPDPLQLVVPQRTTQQIPGLKGQAFVALGDITRGQVVVSLLDAADQPLRTPISLRRGDTTSFSLSGQSFYVRLHHLENNIIGVDHGVLEFSTRDFQSPQPTSSSAAPKNP